VVWCCLTIGCPPLSLSVINIAVEFGLKKSIVAPRIKAELHFATRLAITLLVWDSVFRWELVHLFLEIFMSSESEIFVDIIRIFSLTFACTYVYGVSTLLSYAYERRRIAAFGLYWYRLRYWNLLLGRDRLSPLEIGSFQETQVCRG
jgi:hypothetical protein